AIPVSVWVCGRAEILMAQRDPSSVVLDEIVAVPFSFLWWIGETWTRTGDFPASGQLFENVWLLPAVFAAFRLFDILKPWPVGPSQALPGGWGVTIDDLLAAVYVNLVCLLASAAFGASK